MMVTPSTMARVLSGRTFSTRPRLPRSLPVMTTTLSFRRTGVCRRDMSENLGRERNDLHEPALAQLAGHRPEHARSNRLVLVVDQHGGVAVEADVAAVLAALLLDGADDHRLDHASLLDVRLPRRFLPRGGDNVAGAGVAPGRAADRVDDGDLARAGVVGDVEDRSHLDHGLVSFAFS